MPILSWFKSSFITISLWIDKSTHLKEEAAPEGHIFQRTLDGLAYKVIPLTMKPCLSAEPFLALVNHTGFVEPLAKAVQGFQVQRQQTSH